MIRRVGVRVPSDARIEASGIGPEQREHGRARFVGDLLASCEGQLAVAC